MHCCFRNGIEKVILLMVLAFFLCGITACAQSTVKAKIFDNLEELQCLKEYASDIMPPKDKNLEGLSPDESYCAIIEYNGRLYTVYSYVFQKQDDAKEYFKRETGKDSDEMNCNFSESGNLLANTRYIAFHENKVLYIKGGSKSDYNEFRDYLFEHLSVSLV